MLALAVKTPKAVGPDDKGSAEPVPATPPLRSIASPDPFTGDQLEAFDANECTRGILKRSSAESSPVYSAMSEVQRLEAELEAAKLKLSYLRDSQPSTVRF